VPSEYVLSRRVQFCETDASGFVHFSWYFRYMEEAEHALWRQAGLSIAPPGAELGFLRVAASFDYHRALAFEDEFEVCIRVAAVASKTIRYTCVLARGDTKIATGTMTVACVRLKPGEPVKAIPIPSDIVARFPVAPAVEV
jgi:YbgC/YbaW family acyl-CoA thioester hydrolase